jgi:hypothetical protein
MATHFQSLNDAHKAFINAQKIFFVASSASEGFINLSPKGLDSLKILNPNSLVWLNYTGSGNETASHIHGDGRMTLMFTSFEKEPLILKIYGHARVIHPYDKRWQEMCQHFKEEVGMRQFFEMDVELIITSCGYGVPLFSYKGERKTLQKWNQQKGQKGIENYWRDKNQISLNGKSTHIFPKKQTPKS